MKPSRTSSERRDCHSRGGHISRSHDDGGGRFGDCRVVFDGLGHGDGVVVQGEEVNGRCGEGVAHDAGGGGNGVVGGWGLRRGSDGQGFGCGGGYHDDGGWEAIGRRPRRCFRNGGCCGAADDDGGVGDGVVRFGSLL